MGRPSIAPEKLLRALLLQVLYTIRSERQLMEQLDYNLLYRWFVGLAMDEPVWDPTVFTKNRERLVGGEIAEGFFRAVLEEAEAEGLLSQEHFSVDGTLIEAWASQKSFQPKRERGEREDDDPGNPTVNFRGASRRNETHASTTDPDARLVAKKGREARLAYQGHVLTENRNGLVVGAKLTQASGYAEREAALDLVEQIEGAHPVTLGADRGYDVGSFIEAVRERGVVPHVAQNTTNRRSAIDGRTTRHSSYALSQRARKRVEEVFGWMKTIGLIRKTRHRGTARVGWMFIFTAAAYNLIRIRNLVEAT
jgi:IS5 family transposase